MEEVRSSFIILTDKERTLGRPRRRWEDIVRMDLKGKDVNTRNWIDSTQDGEPFCVRL